MQPGEIYLAYFPFGDVPGMKIRPVLLLTGARGSIPEVLVAYLFCHTCPSSDHGFDFGSEQARISLHASQNPIGAEAS